jgi:hypothetical protein
MTLAQAEASLKLFSREVLPIVHKMEAPLHASVLPGAPAAVNG